MNINRILKGIPPEFHPIAREHIRRAQALGWSENQIDHGAQFYVNYTGEPEEFLTAFQTFATTRLGVPPEDAALATNTAEDLREHINSGKWTPEPAAPPDEKAQLLADIRAMRRLDPDWYRNNQAELEPTEIALLSASLGEPSAQAVLPSPTSDADARLREIRAMIRDDPDAVTRNPALEREQIALIEAQIASRPAAPQVGGDPVSSPAEGA